MNDDAVHLVALDRDHPGFRDPDYRRRRNEIAALALAHRFGAPAPEVAYSAVEQGVWRTVLSRLAPLHARHACAAYLAGARSAALPEHEIPTFAQLNTRLEAASGFHFEPVAGLVSPREFMSHLADGRFLATQYMRHHSTPLYTPEPDVIHEMVGHAPSLHDARVATLHRRFGEATRRADERRVEQLIRLYWFTLEFGLVEESGRVKVLGAGLLSSFGELGRLDQVPRRPFSIEEITSTPFDPTDYQKVYFVAPSPGALYDALCSAL
jgi:phenylalanine-4-hydroxylase